MKANGFRHILIFLYQSWQTVLVKMLFVCLLLSPITGMSQILELDYDGFTVFLDCDRRGAINFEYTAKKDNGNLPRKSSFTFDPEIPEDCQQTSSASYSHSEFAFDRGHLIPANHLDHLKLGIKQSNYMTNILPQARTMNRGAWKLTEEIIECKRDEETLNVIGGVVWGRNPDDDFFIESHGVETPDYFWKVVIGNDKAIAWLIPNSHNAKRSRLDEYIISIEELEEFLHESIQAPANLKNMKPRKSWSLPSGCDKS